MHNGGAVGARAAHAPCHSAKVLQQDQIELEGCSPCCLLPWEGHSRSSMLSRQRKFQPITGAQGEALSQGPPSLLSEHLLCGVLQQRLRARKLSGDWVRPASGGKVGETEKYEKGEIKRASLPATQQQSHRSVTMSMGAMPGTKHRARGLRKLEKQVHWRACWSVMAHSLTQHSRSKETANTDESLLQAAYCAPAWCAGRVQPSLCSLGACVQ